MKLEELSAKRFMMGADCIKIIVNNDKLVLSEEELTTIVEEAKERESKSLHMLRMVTAHRYSQ
jgi:hypothetical protein